MNNQNSNTSVESKHFKNPLISLAYILALIFLLISIIGISTLAWMLPDFLVGIHLSVPSENFYYYEIKTSLEFVSTIVSVLIVVFPIYLLLLFLIVRIELKSPFYKVSFFRNLFVILPFILAVIYLVSYTIYLVYVILSFDTALKFVDLIKYILQLFILVPMILYHFSLSNIKKNMENSN